MAQHLSLWEGCHQMQLVDEMPVRILSTESPKQDANVNEDYEYCLERMKTRGRTISLAGHDNISVDCVTCLSQTAVLLFIQ